jgi:hypothetical protein
MVKYNRENQKNLVFNKKSLLVRKRTNKMWKMIFFIPLFALTTYIIVKSTSGDDENEEEKKKYAEMALKMLGVDKKKASDIEFVFYEHDFSDPKNPYALFDVYVGEKAFLFEVKDQKIYRHSLKDIE